MGAKAQQVFSRSRLIRKSLEFRRPVLCIQTKHPSIWMHVSTRLTRHNHRLTSYDILHTKLSFLLLLTANLSAPTAWMAFWQHATLCYVFSYFVRSAHVASLVGALIWLYAHTLHIYHFHTNKLYSPAHIWLVYCTNSLSNKYYSMIDLQNNCTADQSDENDSEQ
jgi:hypothetical protein